MPELEHDRQRIEILALVHEANAALHFKYVTEQREAHEGSQRPRFSQHEMLGASSFVIAASYWSLIDPRKAIGLYRRASDTYRSLGHSYAMVLALAAAAGEEIPLMLSVVDEMPAPSPQAVAFAMVANEVANADGRRQRAELLDRQWRHIGNMPIGRLGIPLDHYARCAHAMRAARRDQNIEIFRAEAANYVIRAAEVVRSASHDRFHWSQLQSTILPAEPEAIAMTCAMSMMSHSMFKTSITDLPDLDTHGHLLVEVGDQIRNAAMGPEPEPERDQKPKPKNPKPEWKLKLE
jgi:hypothetical protein